MTTVEATNTPMKIAIDGVAAAGIVTTLLGWVPVVVAILGGVWYAYQIYDLWDKRRLRAALRKKRKKS